MCRGLFTKSKFCYHFFATKLSDFTIKTIDNGVIYIFDCFFSSVVLIVDASITYKLKDFALANRIHV